MKVPKILAAAAVFATLALAATPNPVRAEAQPSDIMRQQRVYHAKHAPVRHHHHHHHHKHHRPTPH